MRIRRRRKGGFSLVAEDHERAFMLQVCDELAEIIQATDDPMTMRLFPKPYGDDDDRNSGYAALAVPELIDSRRNSIEEMRSTIDAEELTETELMAWMRSINDMRLVLGTLLGIVDDNSEPEVQGELVQSMAAYHYLGGVLDRIVAALSR